MLLKPLPYALVRQLNHQMKPPPDLADCSCSMTKWLQTFGNRGVTLLVIGMKFPIARKYFVAGYAAAKTTTEAHRVYLGCVFTVLQFGDSDKYRQLAEEMDSIKGPSYCHGLLIFMRRLGIVATSRNSEGIRLGLGATLVTIRQYSPSIATRITAFLRMDPVLAGLTSVNNLETYGKNMNTVVKAMTRFRVPQMAKKGYNAEWCFRSWQIATMRVQGIDRLYYGPTDTVSMLPGPDGKQARRRLGPTRTVASLYEVHGITICPEYICLAACLRSGKYKENVMKISTASIAGRCSTCVRNKKSIHHCRVLLQHKRPATLRPTMQVLKKKALQKRQTMSPRFLKKRLSIPGRCPHCRACKKTRYHCRVERMHDELA